MPNLENLKKQAKLILRRHRERHFPVAAQIRAHLPQFSGMPDADILAADFKLSDAQEVVAREQGFASWQALKRGIGAPPGDKKPATGKAILVGAEPQLFVADVARACAFFCEKLGFTLAFSYGEPPYYAQVVRDAARLNLRCVEREQIDQALREREELLAASMTVASASEIKLLFLEFERAGIAFHQRLRKQPWGARNFIVKDPDGNLLLFAGPGE
jgi:catechol 2,3-dioxygenase-like lactoylglutathione lyase family enzyme